MNYPIYVIFLLTTTLVSSRGFSYRKNGSSHKNGQFELLIFHNSDMHGRFDETSQESGICTQKDKENHKCYGGFARIAHVVKDARKLAKEGKGPPVIFLNAGNTYTGSAWFTLHKWKIAVDFINALHPDVISLGNHEFDNGVPGLVPFLGRVTCPVVAANLNLTKEPALAAIRHLTHSYTLHVNGHDIGIIGYLTPATKYRAIKNFVEYIDEVVAVRREAENLHKNGVKILIALGHSGYQTDLRIAREVEHIDIVVGGHSHTFLWNGTAPDIETPEGFYPTFVSQPSGRLVGTVQAYAFTKYLGKILLTFDSDGEIVRYAGQPILLDNTIAQDEFVLRMVKKYRYKSKHVTDVVIGKTVTNLDGKSCRIKECNMGNLITDAMIYKYGSTYEGHFWTDAPIAFITGREIKASIGSDTKPENITIGHVMAILPFNGFMAKITINGSILLKMLEHSVSKYDQQPRGEFLQVSGLKIEYDASKEPGTRVVSVHVRCGLCDPPTFQPLKENNYYKILVTSYLSIGGDGYSMLLDMPSIPLTYDHRQAITEYIKTHSPVDPETQGRIVFLNSNSDGVSLKTIFNSIFNQYLPWK